MRTVRELQEELKKNRLSVAELTREECFALFEAWTEEYRHGRLRDAELFFACAERVRSFSRKEKPNEGARLVKPEKELRGQIAAEREQQARATRRTLPLLATACVLAVCSAFAIGAGARAVSPRENHFWAGTFDGEPSRWDCFSATDASVAQALEGVPSGVLASEGHPEDCSKAAVSAESLDGMTDESHPAGGSGTDVYVSSAASSVPTAEPYQTDLKTVQSSAEAMFGSSPKLPWSLEDELQAANGILMEGAEIILRTEDMQLQISSFHHTMEMSDNDGSTDISDLSIPGEIAETSEWMIDYTAMEDGESLCYVLYRDGFYYRITARDKAVFEAVKDALAIDD